MRYWWVNQNQTYRHELSGGYLWSPKRNANGARNPFYESMREVSPGDAVFSFVDTRIAAIGIAQSYCWESPKPAEFGDAGQNWENVGWKVSVRFTRLLHRVRPKDHIDVVRAVLPNRYSPLQTSGNGLQSVYLTEVPQPFAEVLARLIGPEARDLICATDIADARRREPIMTGDDLDVWERRLEERVASDASMRDTDRDALIRARLGQGLFKQRVMQIEARCRITGVDNAIHLVASHCKPWRDSSNEERLDGENGLLLTPSIDHLFDRGFIGFEDSGDLIISPVAHRPSLERMGLETRQVMNVGGFTAGQRAYLDFHRNAVLLRAVR
ncbi:MAG TPA: HNH endonuclease signature motif containing protein [Bryobacteraceae bacterium]|nr:HNH endonuclease signature motif containing protein [Bryobacteraceae bacterium]